VTVVVTHAHTPFAGSIHTRQLHALARAPLAKRVAVCGDFNSPPWSGPMRDFASEARLRDLYGGRAGPATAGRRGARSCRVPLDNCFVSAHVAVRAHHDGPVSARTTGRCRRLGVAQA
jgi:endonuclease/exonuclease/phosphatase (EEP) superfamily protein YafD